MPDVPILTPPSLNQDNPDKERIDMLIRDVEWLKGRIAGVKGEGEHFQLNKPTLWVPTWSGTGRRPSNNLGTAGHVIRLTDTQNYSFGEVPSHAISSHNDRTDYFNLALGAGQVRSGTATLGLNGSSLHKMPSWLFDPATEGYVSFDFHFYPAHWVIDGSAEINVTVYWAASNTDTGNIVWNVNLASIAEGEQVDIAADGGNATFAAVGVIDQIVGHSSSTWDITPAAGDLGLRLSAGRNSDDGADTFTGNAYLIGVRITYVSDH